MALKVYNGTNFDSVLLGSESISTANINLTTAYQASIGQTAPNTTDKITGVFFFVAVVPSTGNIEIEVRESGVSKVSGVCNNADINLGWNYLRFTTPYQFTTTAAGAYIAYIRKSLANSGSVARSATGVLSVLLMTYDSVGAIGASDDAFYMGFHDSGMTPILDVLTGTSNSWGSGTDKSMTSATQRTLGAALTIGNGATVKLDDTADCSLTLKGSTVVTRGGVLDIRPGASTVSTLEINCDVADGNYGVMIPSGGTGGQVLTAGSPVAIAKDYLSGVGTTADPVVTDGAHGFVVDQELVFGWGANYQQNEIRFVKSIPASNQIILSTTIGGAEAALTHTHAPNKPIATLTRNSIIKATTSTRGFWLFNNATAGDASDFGFTALEYANCQSGKGINPSSSAHAVNVHGLLLKRNSAAGRNSISISGSSIEENLGDITLFETRGSNFSAQSGLVFQSASKKTVDNVYLYAEPTTTSCCAGISIAATATAIRIKNFYASGGNGGGAAGGYVLGMYGTGNTVENAVIDGSRVRAILLDAGLKNTFVNGELGLVASNTIDVDMTSGVLAQAYFDSCYFGSPTLLNNYLNTLDGSEVAFQNMDGNTSKHRWYTNKGSFVSSGSGLSDTTIRTAGSLALAIKPENNVDGAQLLFKVPANPTSQVLVNGYLYRNATFSSGTLKVDLFLPGTLLTDTPDDTVTLSTDTLEWLPWLLNAYYSGTVSRYATVRITAISSTAGAVAFLDDLYDAGTQNKVAGLDLWDEGKISPIIVAADYSAIPETTRLALWSDSDTYAPGEKGYMPDQLDNIASEQTLPNLLIKDKLS